MARKVFFTKEFRVVVPELPEDSVAESLLDDLAEDDTLTKLEDAYVARLREIIFNSPIAIGPFAVEVE